jgi:hypothetical protein
MIDPTRLRRRPTSIDRSGDRWVALGAIAIAVGFLVLAGLAGSLPAATRRGIWLPLHLALAGGAATAIAGIMPFFAAAFSAAPPSDPRLRWTAVVGVAAGALGVSVGVVASATGLAVAGGVAFVTGTALTGLATALPLRRALGPSRGIVTLGYLVALGEVGVGATLATLLLAGWPPVVEAWARLKPAHGWLNLVGFVSLVIATTLLHFFPTVIGARIAGHPSARLTVTGLAVGAPVVALGYAVSSDLLARLGAVVALAGALALVAYTRRIWPTRGRWTTDPGWHRFAAGGLVSAIVWLVVGMAIAVGRTLAFGADPVLWSADAIVGPLVVGWAGAAVLASATHLVPAVGPGDPAIHARQRAILGLAAGTRLTMLDLAVAALSVGLPLGHTAVTAVGALLGVVAFGSTAILIARGAWIGARAARR